MQNTVSTNKRSANSVRNIVSGFLFKFVSLIIPFIIRTIMIKKLGMDYLGLNTLFVSILQVLSLSELGFSTAVSFCMYKPVSENNLGLICALLNYIKKIYRIVGVVILCVGLILIPFLPKLINGGYPSDINIYILYLIYLFNTVISYFLFAYQSVLLVANQRNDIDNQVSIIVSIVIYILQIVVLLVFSNYYIYIMFLPLSTICINLLRNKICKRQYPNISCSGIVDKNTKQELINKIKALFGHKLCSIIVSSTDSIIISAYLGLTVLGTYNNYYYIMNTLMSFIMIFFSSITPSIGNSLINESVEKNNKDFNSLTFVNVWIVGWMSITLLCLYQHFMRLWVGDGLMLPTKTAVLFVIYLYSWMFKDILSTYKSAAGLWEADFAKPYVVSIVNIVLDLVLIKYIGVNGVLLATILSVPLISLPWETHVFFKCYFKKGELRYYLRLLIYTVCLLLICYFTYYCCELLPNDGYLWFILKFVICIFLPNAVIILLSFKTEQFKWIVCKLKMFLKHNKKVKNNEQTLS
ncbi:MAG: hypothetical protein MJ066_01260 [Clostridia bacterium]|nr:hypothetical protein [Clostridia bacterium]